jgi:predicted esterase
LILAHLLLHSALASLRAHGAWGVAYPPADDAEPKPALVYLHGMWSSPEESCAMFEPAAAPFGFLVCPRGNAPMNDGSAGKMWSGSYATAAPSVHAALDAAGALGNVDRSGGGTLMGYSNGAYFAAEIAMHEPGRWTGLVLLSMHLDVDPARLSSAGVKRVVLASGDADMARASMKELADRLDAGGVPSRFISLGPGGHELPRDVDLRMTEAVAWVRD